MSSFDRMDIGVAEKWRDLIRLHGENPDEYIGVYREIPQIPPPGILLEETEYGVKTYAVKRMF